jgi:hypothetical protein
VLERIIERPCHPFGAPARRAASPQSTWAACQPVARAADAVSTHPRFGGPRLAARIDSAPMVPAPPPRAVLPVRAVLTPIGTVIDHVG